MSAISYVCFLPLLVVSVVGAKVLKVKFEDTPKFVGSDTNVTVVIGRDATLTCTVENLQKFKVAWLKVDTQTILTIGNHVITKNHRVSIGKGDQTWSLTIRDIRLSDAGQYMCQLNTEPMTIQTHHLQVSVPPDIINSSSSGEITVREGENVSLHCSASGAPQPTITWRREDLTPMKIGSDVASKWNGVWLNMSSVSRDINGAFLCIATNGVPPSVSKRILLRVMCKPKVHVTQKMIGAYIGDTINLHCKIEAFPPPVITWTHQDTIKLQNGTKYQVITESKSYKHTVILRVYNVSREDIGSYYCCAENQLGSSKDDVTLYTLATTTMSTSTTERTTTAWIPKSTQPSDAELEVSVDDEGQKYSNEDSFVVVLSQQQMQNIDLSPSS
ncbi:lachesin-like [Bombyx mandarina]|uniref:Lachesin-like n=1 Tax=Bombyx mandarina TaxID=7092 RepID=A0A6J2J9C2_BOMMA|nr:lachesin-like [Bombyx mandarina]